jgi:hypothetical protein
MENTLRKQKFELENTLREEKFEQQKTSRQRKLEMEDPLYQQIFEMERRTSQIFNEINTQTRIIIKYGVHYHNHHDENVYDEIYAPPMVVFNNRNPHDMVEWFLQELCDFYRIIRVTWIGTNTLRIDMELYQYVDKANENLLKKRYTGFFNELSLADTVYEEANKWGNHYCEGDKNMIECFLEELRHLCKIDRVRWIGKNVCRIDTTFYESMEIIKSDETEIKKKITEIKKKITEIIKKFKLTDTVFWGTDNGWNHYYKGVEDARTTIKAFEFITNKDLNYFTKKYGA